MLDNLPLPPEPTIADAQQAIQLWDLANPRSVVNMVPTKVREAMLRLANESPELADKDEQHLKRHLKEKRFYSPTATDNRLRFNFWAEHDRAIGMGDTIMRLSSIIGNICSIEIFVKTFLRNDPKVSWLLCPPTDYKNKNEELLSHTVDSLREIVDYPNLKASGDIDYKLLAIKLQILKIADARAYGAATQRILNYTKGEIALVNKTSQIDREREIEGHIKRLEAEARDEVRILETSVKAILPEGMDGF